jgi:hypothetical protein
MWQKPGGRQLRFTAVEEFAVEEVAFSWPARFPIVPFVSLHVVDRYTLGEGLLEARLFRLIPVMRASGPELSEGEAMRYLAELPWVPHAMLVNRELEWRDLDAETVEVATRVGSERAAVRLEFDAAGDIVGTLRTRAHVPRARRACRHRGAAASVTTACSTGSAFRCARRSAGSSRTGRSPTGAGRSGRSS